MTALSAPPNSAQDSERSLQDLIQSQRAFFATGKTKPLDFRLEQLNKLKSAITERQDAIIQAAQDDLGRPEFEGYFEIGVTAELSYVLKKLKSWVKPQKVGIPLSQMPGSAWVQPEPLGCVLIIGPWNYPFQLVISPLIGAIAAGNCAIIKPSEIAPATSKVVAELIESTFDPSYVAVREGGVETAQALLAEKFDHIFFTGGTRVGQIVMEAAAKQLTPVTLELGGKSPCIIDSDINVEVAAKRVVWGKYLNAGQTCVAPDYLLVHQDIKSDFVKALQQVIQDAYGDNPAQSSDFSRLVSDRQFDRVASLIEGEEVITGGQTDRGDKFIAPTVLDSVSWDAPVMQDEIFGPILPVLEYQDIDDAIAQINARPKPLALYLFSRSQSLQEKVLSSTSSGGVCINDVFLHVAIWGMPFGGVGDSGIGAYHGKTSFDTFSHMKSILKKPFWLDLDWRYPPYAKKLDFFKKIVSLS
ncbi:aldehyde dehydrogenase [cf. Phormidesmis sp. LEGE 11477]|uniref:aldehyde dehydrogenase n=1 Tax=cf. Phormidesmis sp. LEGE 11477 TaxID=1828680 RepID=UPI001882784C|nr:aldehyde dehydrogenase [cf. Phormidesmis sp. LEGE 11477]MBE9059532.1 aldehyde dehydrogenase [cf. Phormidesmis sp. LEGE 11477]